MNATTESLMPVTDTQRPGLFGQIREDIDCVFARDPAARSRFEVLTTYPGVHAVITHRFAHRLWHAHLRYPARLLGFLARMFTGVDIHPAATIGRRLFIDHATGVVIGETAVVGDDCTLYHGVTLGGTRWTRGKRHPTLGHGVVVGAGAKVLGPIEVGNRARVGANSVVVRDVPAERTVVGIPARIVKVERDPGPDGIDLDHHLIPDPVGRAIACLIDRVRSLESQLAEVRHVDITTKECGPNCACVGAEEEAARNTAVAVTEED
ncbi:serine O-acetyltransferase [Plasticicumulans acidivorans]|uniref:Serine acetyltransferase n=2 Tax=Plasticicumulans acidivorans TaxID=886464 RepID=A0A317MVM0_9GAMM|nr:serine O-acetyltransferase [Plasticicumulans acidivorans]